MLKNAKVHAEATKALCSSEGVTENTDGTYVCVCAPTVGHLFWHAISSEHMGLLVC